MNIEKYWKNCYWFFSPFFFIFGCLTFICMIPGNTHFLLYLVGLQRTCTAMWETTSARSRLVSEGRTFTLSPRDIPQERSPVLLNFILHLLPVLFTFLSHSVSYFCIFIEIILFLFLIVPLNQSGCRVCVCVWKFFFHQPLSPRWFDQSRWNFVWLEVLGGSIP